MRNPSPEHRSATVCRAPVARSKQAATQTAQSASPADSDDRLDIDLVQLERLATAVLSKSPDDLAALAQANPMLIEEWRVAFYRQHAAALTQARFWASAYAALATSHQMVANIAAE